MTWSEAMPGCLIGLYQTLYEQYSSLAKMPSCAAQCTSSMRGGRYSFDLSEPIAVERNTVAGIGEPLDAKHALDEQEVDFRVNRTELRG
jgi:hypothetical protein